jgi:hypothetical protein
MSGTNQKKFTILCCSNCLTLKIKSGSMKKIEELKLKTSDTIMILLDTKEVFNYCKYLYEPPKYEESELANSLSYIRLIRFALYKQTVIELSKLISSSNNDNFRISKYINALKSDGYYGDLHFPKQRILKYEADLASVEKIKDDIILLRNDFYAHTKRIFTYANSMNYSDFYLFIPPPIIEKLITILTNIFVDVYSCLFGSDLDLSIESDTENITILSDMVTIRRLEKEAFLDSF